VTTSPALFYAPGGRAAPGGPRAAAALEGVDDEHDDDDRRDAGDEPDEDSKHVGLVLKRIEPAARTWFGTRDGPYKTYTVV
jgi:hypothetical protein